MRVPSSLEAVGLTAAVAGALAADGISANVIAAFHHDHVLALTGTVGNRIGGRSDHMLLRLDPRSAPAP